VYSLTFEFIFVAVWFLVAAVIFWRKSNERLAWFVSLMLLTFGATFPDPLGALASQQPAWWWPVNVVAFLGVVTLVLCFFLFPDGRFVPRWTGLVGLLWILWDLYWLFSTGLIVFPGPWLLSYLGLLGLGVFAQMSDQNHFVYTARCHNACTVSQTWSTAASQRLTSQLFSKSCVRNGIHLVSIDWRADCYD